MTRDTPLIKSHDTLRRVRKALLSDLSTLVKSAKELQDVANGILTEDGVDALLDTMLLRAFKIVTRGVVFLDIWNEVSRPPDGSMAPSMYSAADAPLTPPADSITSGSSIRRHSTLREANSSMRSEEDLESVSSAHTQDMQSDRSRSVRTSMIQQRGGENNTEGQTLQPPAIQPKRTSMSHRLSHAGKSATKKNPNLVSNSLGTHYDAFLSVLGSFIGLHLQSRSSSELLVTTQQAVKSCRKLITIIEAVMNRDGRRPELLRKAKESMVDKITELARAAQDAFRPLKAGADELVFIPDDGKRLVDAATACVRAAGECVAFTRIVLEQIGDFELEPVEFSKKSSKLSRKPSQLQVSAPRGTTVELSAVKNITAEQDFARPTAPRLVIPQGDFTASSPITDSTFTPASEVSAPAFPPLLPMDTPVSAASIDSDDIPPTPPPKENPPTANRDSKTLAQGSSAPTTESESRTVSGTSHGTFVSSVRGSEFSTASVALTNATSVDHNSSSDTIPETSERYSGSLNPTTDDGDETEARVLETTYAHELCTRDGRIVGGTLRGLIERLTAYDATPDSEFVSTFYLTFRLFATPVGFAQALVERFEYIGDSETIASPVRLRVYNRLKGWLEGHWRHDCDNTALPTIQDFARKSLMAVLPAAATRLLELTEKVTVVHGPVIPRLAASLGKTNTAIAQFLNPDTPLPAPLITKKQVAALKNWKTTGATLSITDFDAMELARQLTIKVSQIFCSILPEELLATEWTKQSGSLAVNVRAMSTLSTDLASLVADSILQQEDAKKRAEMIKQWIKIAKKCLELNNYDSLMAIYCALTNSTITRMRRTWELVSPKSRATLDILGGIVDVSKNYAGLRQQLQSLMPPCLPFVGMYLTDLTFVDHGNPATRQMATSEGSTPVINFDKHVKTAKIISDLQRFQLPYRLEEIPELQTWIQDQLVRVRSTGDKSFQKFYRRSLVLEPKEVPSRRPSPSIHAMPQPLRQETKERFDFLSWTHSSKDKSITTH